jgi:ABC-2 type transport system ATP-binding protein
MITLKNLQKNLEGRIVIDIPSLEVQAGKVVALLGKAGSGRDILFQILTGTMQPTRGSVSLCGEDPYQNRSAFSQQVGVLFAEGNLYKRISVIGNLQFYSRLYHLPKTRAADVLDKVGLTDQAHVNASELSPGFAKRLTLGRAILNHPRILLMSDPFTGCDDASINVISEVVREYAESGTSVMILTQDITDVEMVCDIVYLLSQGRIVDSYNPQEENQAQQPFLVPARDTEKIVLIDPADILYIYAQDDRAYLQTGSGSLPTRFTLAELEKRLSRSGFFRAHRSYLVNLQQVKEVIPYTRNSFSLRLKDSDGTIIPLSKSSERELRQLLGY